MEIKKEYSVFGDRIILVRPLVCHTIALEQIRRWHHPRLEFSDGGGTRREAREWHRIFPLLLLSLSRHGPLRRSGVKSCFVRLAAHVLVQIWIMRVPWNMMEKAVKLRCDIRLPTAQSTLIPSPCNCSINIQFAGHVPRHGSMLSEVFLHAMMKASRLRILAWQLEATSTLL